MDKEQGYNEKIIKEIYDKNYLGLFLYLSRYTTNVQDIEDVIQNVFLKILSSPELIFSVKNIHSYIFLSARNRMLNMLRDQRRISDKEVPFSPSSIDDADQRLGLSEDMDLNQLLNEVNKAINSLPPQCRKIFMLAKRNGKKYREIAQEMGISTKTVENQMGIALHKIRESLRQSNRSPLSAELLSVLIAISLAHTLP